jgi:hypothetical protein
VGFISSNFLSPAKGSFEIQRAYNWSLEIALDDAGDQMLIMSGLESFEAPTETTEEIMLDYGSSKRYVAGKTTFATSVLVLKDFVDQGVANAIIKWRRQVFNADSDATGFARDYKKSADLILVAPDNSVSRIWKLYGVWPTSVHYGRLAMNQSEKVTISVTLRYDRALPGSNLSLGLAGINAGVLVSPLT